LEADSQNSVKLPELAAQGEMLQAARIEGRRIAIVTPVYNDWASLQHLLAEIDALPKLAATCVVVAVNDGSSETPPRRFDLGFERIERIELVNLACNLGHQRAIAVGLTVANTDAAIDGVVVMDSDGEDRPDDISRLLAAALPRPETVVCAKRARRSESISFKCMYALYKAAFFLLTGSRIDFGNYCYIPAATLPNVIHNPQCWNHIAATIVRSGIPFRRIDTERGRRYAGRSRMNFVSLVIHGLSAISVYADVALVRLLALMFAFSGAAVAGIIAVIIIRFATNLAVPGWATTAAGSLAIMFFQSAFFAAISAFTLLAARSAKPMIPAIDGMQYVVSREVCVRGTPADAVTR